MDPEYTSEKTAHVHFNQFTPASVLFSMENNIDKYLLHNLLKLCHILH